MIGTQLPTIGFVAASLAAAPVLSAQLLPCSLTRQRDGAFAGDCRLADTPYVRMRLTSPKDPTAGDWVGAADERGEFPMPVTLATQGSRGALRSERPWRAVTNIRTDSVALSFTLNLD